MGCPDRNAIFGRYVHDRRFFLPCQSHVLHVFSTASLVSLLGEGTTGFLEPLAGRKFDRDTGAEEANLLKAPVRMGTLEINDLHPVQAKFVPLLLDRNFKRGKLSSRSIEKHCPTSEYAQYNRLFREIANNVIMISSLWVFFRTL